MSRLHIYTVHINPGLPQPYEAAEFVEEGFNWKAFVFGGFWALYRKLWWVALALFAFSICVTMLYSAGTLTHSGLIIVELAMHTIAGFFAGDWRRAGLKARGYITADIVSGDSLLRGQQRFFDRYFASQPIAPFVG